MSENNDTPSTDVVEPASATNAPPPYYYFTMVMAEVVYRLGNDDLSSRRVQFFSKSDDVVFPAARLLQIQNVAAMTVREELPEEKHKEFLAVECIIHVIHPLGLMTDLEFYGPQEASSEPN